MSDEKKLQIDEDWKEKVQLEKEQTTTSANPAVEPAPQKPANSNDPTLPPPTFSMHVTMLATQALVALGQMADPVQGKVVVRKNLARHYIDTLGMLEAKTKGQLTTEEATLLEGALHDLRMMFVHVK